jgi:large subunit ribosomal protein L4
MATTSILNWDKKKVGEVELPAEVFGQELRKDLLHTVVRWQLASRRQGTAMTKTKGLVSGGGKKPFKQKGTGNARQGSSRSPLMPGGGTMFGPEPRDYSYALPKKMRQAGLRVALSYLQTNGKLFVVENMKSEGKTAELSKRLQAFGLKKAVLIDGDADSKFDRASRNLPKFRYYSVDGLNVYDLLKYDTAVVTKASLDRILARCGWEKK